MTQAGLDYEQCTPDELHEIIQPSGKHLWELLAQVEESKWNQKIAADIKLNATGSRSFFKVGLQHDLLHAFFATVMHGRRLCQSSTTVKRVMERCIQTAGVDCRVSVASRQRKQHSLPCMTTLHKTHMCSLIVMLMVSDNYKLCLFAGGF